MISLWKPLFLLFCLVTPHGFSDTKLETFMCVYYFPNLREPRDLFRAECESWCERVLQGQDKGQTIPPIGSICDMYEVGPSNKKREQMTAACKLKGYKFCKYEGLLGGDPFIQRRLATESTRNSEHSFVDDTSRRPRLDVRGPHP